jgi:hypothetical protein
MKRWMWRCCWMATLVGVLAAGGAVRVFAQERDVPGERLERLERRVNELAQRQEQFMRRLEAQGERRGQLPGLRRENLRQPLRPPDAPAPPPPHAAKLVKGLSDTLGLFFVVAILCNILLTIWIYTDIRKRNEGSGLFVALALVAGVPAALIYALTRIADKKA